MIYKDCSRCFATKPITQYHSNGEGGKRGWCGECQNKRKCDSLKKFRIDNPETQREIDRRANRLKFLKNRRFYLNKSALEAKTFRGAARRKLRNAVSNGHITKPKSCQKCKAIVPKNRIHGHHTDYSKPLDVIWLCSVCHSFEHTLLREGEK